MTRTRCSTGTATSSTASRCQRASALAVPLGFAGFTIFAIWWLDIPFSQIGPGLASLAKFIALMFPPSSGGHLNLLLKAMGETLAIAFLGTLMATVVAFPISFLRRTIPRPSRHSLRHPALSRHHPRCRCADLGAGLCRRRRPRSVRGDSRDRGVRHRGVRQTVLGGDRIHRGTRAGIGAGERRHGSACGPLRPDAAGAADDRRADPYFLIQRALGHHHRHRRRRRYRRSTGEINTGTTTSDRWLRHHDDPYRGRGDRLDLDRAALCPHRPARGALKTSPH